MDGLGWRGVFMKFIYIYISIYVGVCIYICMYVCIYVCVCIYHFKGWKKWLKMSMLMISHQKGNRERERDQSQKIQPKGSPTHLFRNCMLLHHLVLEFLCKPKLSLVKGA
jgi:hypothetical protein